MLISMDMQHEEQFYEYIRKFNEATIILLISYVDYGSILKAMEYGADDYIVKPFMMDFLIKKIELFQKIKDCDRSRSRMHKFISDMFSNRIETDMDVRLPVIVVSNSPKERDAFAYFYSQNKGFDLEVISFDKLKKLKKHFPDVIYYIRQGFQENQLEELATQAKEKNIIVASNNFNLITPDGFSKVVLEDVNRYIHVESVIPINDYVKYIILKYQNFVSDTELAQLLGISRKSLWEKRRRFGIQKQK
jgi:YesN/AraC family two-component response regulator